uniref:Mevalonate kinase n=1 Tax=Acrobeloides nanus TaxID=290746 RepID=A0A914ES42_9BILA
MESPVIEPVEERPIDRNILLTNIQSFINDKQTIDLDVARLLLADAASLLDSKQKQHDEDAQKERPPSDSSLNSSELEDYQRLEDSPSASSSSSHVMTNHLTSSFATSSPMRSLSSASGGLYLSAPGKIILFGEHAVVYGRTAIAGSIDLRTYVSLFTSADGRIYLSLPDLNVEKTWMLKDLLKAVEKLSADYPLDDGPPSLEIVVPIARKLSGSCEDGCGVQHLAILAFWYLLIGVTQRKRMMDSTNDAIDRLSNRAPNSSRSTCELQDPNTKDLLAVKVTVKFKLPACVGLGSSGAYCVCIAAALLQTAGIIPPPMIQVDEDGSVTWDDIHLDIIRKWAAAAESLIHGRASGLDAAVCTYGGVASYKPGRPIENLRNIPELKVILVNSKVERNTSRMVQTVKERLKKFPEVIDGIFNAIDAISREAARILQKTPDENGGALENGGRSATLTPSFAPEMDHHSLQPISVGERSSSLGSYVLGGKRGSTASAISGVSGGDGRSGGGGDRGELTDTFSKLNDLARINNQLLIGLGVGHPKVDQICTLLARYGIHPKMTGAGGGGSVFAFLKPDTSQTVIGMIRNELAKLDYDMWQPPLGGPGVCVHAQKPDLFVNTASSSRSTTPAGSHQSTPAVPIKSKK